MGPIIVNHTVARLRQPEERCVVLQRVTPQGGRPSSGSGRNDGLQERHTECISAVPSRLGRQSTKGERRALRVTKLQAQSDVKKRKVEASRSLGSAEKMSKKMQQEIHPDVQYLYDGLADRQRVMWGKGEARQHMELAIERAKFVMEFGSVPNHPEMNSLRNVCLYTLGLRAYKSYIRRVRGEIDLEACPGPWMALSTEDEKHLEEHLKLLADMGWGADKDYMKDMAVDIARAHGNYDFIGSDGFFERFMARHPTLTRRLGNDLERTRARGCNVQMAEAYFKLL